MAVSPRQSISLKINKKATLSLSFHLFVSWACSVFLPSFFFPPSLLQHSRVTICMATLTAWHFHNPGGGREPQSTDLSLSFSLYSQTTHNSLALPLFLSVFFSLCSVTDAGFWKLVEVLSEMKVLTVDILYRHSARFKFDHFHAKPHSEKAIF